MYERYFQLRERPFALSPDPEYLYPSRVHQEALNYLRYGIEGHAGFVVITGEIGSGKTTMLQSLLCRLDRSTAVARIMNTMLDARELLEAILLDFGLDPTGLSKPVMLHRLGEYLIQQRQAGRLTLLVIDEAQNLNLLALEEIRMLSNLETEKSKLIQIILIGQPELRDTLALPQLEQLRQRITVSYHLLPLDVDETQNYINHRLRRAAIGPALELPREVTDVIHERSRGVPRIINVIADATLLFAYGVDRRDVDVSIVREALEELDGTGVLASYNAEGGRSGAGVTASAAHSGSDTSDQVIGDDGGRLALPVDMRAQEDARRREEALKQREQQIALREQAVAAQQKVVEEEARLLAAARSIGTQGAPGASGALGAAGAMSASGGAPGGSAAGAPGPAARIAIVAPRGAGTSTIHQSRLAPHAPFAPITTSAPPAPGAFRAPAQAASFVTASGVRVQRYQQAAAYQRQQTRYGMWERLRRVLFGVTEPDM